MKNKYERPMSLEEFFYTCDIRLENTWHNFVINCQLAFQKWDYKKQLMLSEMIEFISPDCWIDYAFKWSKSPFFTYEALNNFNELWINYIKEFPKDTYFQFFDDETDIDLYENVA